MEAYLLQISMVEVESQEEESESDPQHTDCTHSEKCGRVNVLWAVHKSVLVCWHFAIWKKSNKSPMGILPDT